MSYVCDECLRAFAQQKELEVHLKYYHKQPPSGMTIVVCPDCGGMVAMLEGCKTCLSCGWSKCT